MTIRKTDFIISTPIHEGFKELGYNEDVQAICILNQSILVFTVMKWKPIFRKTKYRLRIYLNCIKTGREYGVAYYDTIEEAIKVGSEFVKQRFPEIE